MKIEFFEETNFSYRRKQDLEKDLIHLYLRIVKLPPK